MSASFTPGPWEYVPSNENHGPYVSGLFGGDIADCYVMSQPSLLSKANGGESEPVHFMGEQADANARLIAAAPDLLEAAEAVMASTYAAHYRLISPFKELVAAIAKAKGGAQ